MRPSRSSLVALSLWAALAPGLRAQGTSAAQQLDAQGQEGAAFLLLPVGGRAAALGQAAVADGGSSEAAYWNPAGLARMLRGEVAFHHASTFISDNTAIAAYLTANRIGVFGASAYLVDFGLQPATPGPGQPTGQFATKNVEILSSYATELTADLAFGINYKLIQFRQECMGDCAGFPSVVGTTHGVDVGFQYAPGASDKLHIGLALQHAGFKLQVHNRDQADPLPTRVQIGVAYRFTLPRPEGVEQGVDARVLFDMQESWGSYTSPDARVGLDVGVGDLLRLRAGYAFLHTESSGPAVGIGVRVGRVSIDFAQVFFDSSLLDEPVHFSLRLEL